MATGWGTRIDHHGEASAKIQHAQADQNVPRWDQHAQECNWVHQQPEHVLTIRSRVEHVTVFNLYITVKHTTYPNVKWNANWITVIGKCDKVGCTLWQQFAL